MPVAKLVSQGPSLLAVLISILILWLLYRISLVIYYLCFHPLAAFPGPKIAAATKLFEFYHDVIRGGQFYKEIQRMHEVYGPIVRINPHEIHINDATYYDTIYAGPGNKRDKYPWFTAAGGSPLSAFATQHHDLHRLRRSALNPFFSKASVLRLEPMIHDKVSKMCYVLEKHLKHDKVFEFGAAYLSFALDTVTEYAFGKSRCWGCLDQDEFAVEWKEAIMEAFENATLVRYVPWVAVVLLKVPHEWILKVHKPMGMFFKSAAMIRGTVNDFLAKENKGFAEEQTIFSSLRNGSLPESETTPKRLLDEGNILIAAGGEAITQLLSTTSFHLLENPRLLERLQAELTEASPDASDMITWKQAERLPYLTAIITEALRISAKVTTRLPRVSPDEALQYKQWIIPPGTPVSSTSAAIHSDPSLWPEPLKFDPERWTNEPSTIPKGKKELIFTFSKGTRGCLGVNLAYAQAYLVIANVFRKFDLELFETTTRDITTVRDCFNGQPFKGSKGVRAKVVGLRR